MPHRSKIAWWLVVLATIGAFAAGCGEDRSHLLPGENVREITANIDTVQRLVDEGQCFEALEATEVVKTQAEALPRSVDPKLKRSLIDGVVTLTILVGRQCEDDPVAGTTGDTEPEEEPDPEVTPTGDTGATDETTTTTGPGGKKDRPETEETPEPGGPAKEPKTPAPPAKVPPTTPTPTPPEPTPPTDTGPGSGGISPNQ